MCVRYPKYAHLFNNSQLNNTRKPRALVVCNWWPIGDTRYSTGRKIIVDVSRVVLGAHGGGASSGKDPSKADRCGWVGAKQAHTLPKPGSRGGLCDAALVQVSYATGVAQPHINKCGYFTVHRTVDFNGCIK